jgi:hypothetical protein
MGVLKISTEGSFKYEYRAFSAMQHGHAQAVAEAIKFLSERVLPDAIANDHKCHEEGVKPQKGFEKKAEA